MPSEGKVRALFGSGKQALIAKTAQLRSIDPKVVD